MPLLSLYRRLLGADFDRLPPSLRDFHDVTGEWRGRATFKVTRGRGALRRLACTLGGLPAEGEHPLTLHRIAEGEGERWVRHFGALKLQSRQWTRDGLLIEQFGGVRIGFRVQLEPPTLKLRHARTWVLGIPWPRALGPGAWGEETGREGGVDVVARAFAPLLGMLVQYEGLLVRA